MTISRIANGQFTVNEIPIDGGSQLGHAGEYATADSLGSNVAEEALDHIQPGYGGWREVHVAARMFVGVVVVGNQVQRLVLRCLPINLTQEPQPLGMRVPLLALPDDRAIQDVERGKQGGGAVCACSRESWRPRIPSSVTVAAPVASGSTPGSGFSGRSTAPRHARAGTCKDPQCLQASP